jgi:hypothetical protein
MAKAKRAAAAAKRIAGNIARGSKGTVISAVTGAAAYKLGQMAYQQSDTIKKQPYALPILMVIGGHFLKRKSIDAGAALIGVGAFMGVQAYEANANKNKSASASATTPAGTVATEAKGLTDAGWAARVDNAARGARSYAGAGALVGGPPMRLDTTPRDEAGAVRDPRSMRSAMGLEDC